MVAQMPLSQHFQCIKKILHYQDSATVAQYGIFPLRVPFEALVGDEGVLSAVPECVTVEDCGHAFWCLFVALEGVFVRSFVDYYGVSPGVGEGIEAWVVVEVGGRHGAEDLGAWRWQNLQQANASGI